MDKAKDACVFSAIEMLSIFHYAFFSRLAITWLEPIGLDIRGEPAGICTQSIFLLSLLLARLMCQAHMTTE